MKTTLISGRALSTEHISAWASLQSANPSYESPFFRPEFTQAVAAVRDDVEVAVLEQGGQYVGFFPFQRTRTNIARPVGGRLSDFQGVVLKAGIALDPMRLVHDCQLSAWYFDSLITEQSTLASFQWRRESSPYIDLSAGYENYLAERRAAGATEVLQALKKGRKSERQFGPIRVEMDCRDTDVLAQLIRWKSKQYERSGNLSPLSFGWSRALLESLLKVPSDPNFCGALSALYIGDRLAAAHFGMRSRHILHLWFPAYDPELRKHSPGSQLFLALAKAASSIGVERLHLGKGREPFKESFMNGATSVAGGSVDTLPARRTMRRLWHNAHSWVRASPLRKPITYPWLLLKRFRDQLEFR